MFNENLKYVPYIICVISYMFMTLIAILPSLTLGKRVNAFGKLFLYFAILLLPMGLSSGEILGRILQFHFYMWIITFCLLVYRYDNKDKRKLLIILTDVIILSIIATFPSVLILVLAYALIELFNLIKRNFYNQELGTKEKRFDIKKIKQATILEFKKFSTWSFLVFCIFVFILAIMIILKMRASSSMAFETGGNAENIVEFLVRGMCYLFIWPFYDNLNKDLGILIVCIVLIFYVGNTFFVKKESRKFYILALLSFFTITIVTLSSRFFLTNHLAHFTIRTVPDRYYITMNLASLFPLAIIISDGLRKKILSKIISLIIFLYYSVLIFVYHDQIFLFQKKGLSWLSGVSYEERLYNSFKNNQLNDDETLYVVEIDPYWKMLVPKDRMIKSVYEAQ